MSSEYAPIVQRWRVHQHTTNPIYKSTQAYSEWPKVSSHAKKNKTVSESKVHPGFLTITLSVIGRFLGRPYRSRPILVSVRRPSLWHFLRRLKDEERHVCRTVRQARAGIQTCVRRCKWRKLEERIDRLKRQYTAGTITLKEFWDVIRYATHYG